MSAQNNEKNIVRLNDAMKILVARIDALVVETQKKDTTIAMLVARVGKLEPIVIVLDMKSRGSGPTG